MRITRSSSWAVRTLVCDPANRDERSDFASAVRFLAASVGKHERYSLVGTGHFNFGDMSMWYIAPPLR